MIACNAPPSLYIHWNSESMLLVLWRQRCVQAGHWSVHTQLIFLHDQKMFEVHLQGSIGHCFAAPFSAVAPATRPASASPAPRRGPAAPSNLAFPNPSVKGLVLQHARLATASLSHTCSCWISHRRAFNSTMSVCKTFPFLLHELNCSCHRNSCPELTF